MQKSTRGTWLQYSGHRGERTKAQLWGLGKDKWWWECELETPLFPSCPWPNPETRADIIEVCVSTAAQIQKPRTCLIGKLTEERASETPNTQPNNCTSNDEHFSCYIVLLVWWHTPERSLEWSGSRWETHFWGPIWSVTDRGQAWATVLVAPLPLKLDTRSDILAALQNPAATGLPSFLLHGSAKALIISTDSSRLKNL